MRNLLFLWVLFLYLLVCGKAGAQNLSIIDSLHAVRKNLSTEDQFDVLNAVGFEYRYSFPDSTIFYCTQAYELGKTLALSKDLSKPLSFIGLAFANKGDYNRSAEYHEWAIQVAQQQQDSVQLGFGYNNLGRMFFDGGDLERASTNLFHAKEIFEDLEDKSGLAYVYRSLANIYKTQQDYQQAIQMSTKALQLRTELNDKRAIVSSLVELGLIYESIGETEKALQNLAIADSVAELINDRVTLAEVEQAVAEILLVEGEYEKAFQHASNVLTIVAEITNLRLTIRASLVKAKYLIWKNKCREAIPIFNDVISRSAQSGNLNYEIEATRLAAGCYRLLGDKRMEEGLLTRQEVLRERIINVDLQRQIERLEFQLQISKKERENELLKASQANSESQLSAQRFQNRLLIILVISISMVSVILWSFNRKRRFVNRKLQEQNERILKQQEEISNVNEDLIRQNQQLSELNYEKNSLMNIVAHDLKSPLNRITGLANIMELEGGLPDKQQEYLHLIKNATRSGSNMIIDLLDVNSFEENGHAPNIVEFDVKRWLEERVNTFQLAAQAKSIQLSSENSLSGNFNSDPEYLNRILDNLISNAIKFSPKNREVLVSGKLEANRLRISVKDEGPGFSIQDKAFVYKKFKKLSARPTGGESSNGLGLAIVKTLVDRLRGEINLISEQGRGSEFIVTIPAAKE
jgi:signal transduction histidine kinase